MKINRRAAYLERARLGYRIGDFLTLKGTDLPPPSQRPPISFVVMADKGDVASHGFLSQETGDLLKVCLLTPEKKQGNPHLFPSK